MPCGPVDVQTKREIIFMSAGKSVVHMYFAIFRQQDWINGAHVDVAWAYTFLWLLISSGNIKDTKYFVCFLRKFNKLTSVFYASFLLLMINFVITLSKCCRSTSCRRLDLQQTLTMWWRNLSSIRGQTHKNWRQFVFYNNKKPKLIFKRRKEMQESMEGAIAPESEFHRCNSENHSLVNWNFSKNRPEIQGKIQIAPLTFNPVKTVQKIIR